MTATLFVPLLTAACGFACEDPTESLLKPGDRVAFVGGSYWEEERRDGEIETALTLAVPDVTFRHLGWAGDMVDQSARRFFGTAEDGREHLLEHVDLVKPTVIFVAYGQAESLPGGMSVGDFTTHLESLLSELKERSDRIVVLGPPPQFGTGASDRDQVLAVYSKAAKDVAERSGVRFTDAFGTLRPYAAAADSPASERTLLALAAINRWNWVRASPNAAAAGALVMPLGLVGGDGEFSQDALETADEKQRAASDLYRRVFSLRDLIRAKNDLFLHRHRPQNETYLRGFRAHEQGNNAAEIEKFEPLIAAKDAEIQTLRDQIVKDAE